MVEIKLITYQELTELNGFDAAVSAYALECSMPEIGQAQESRAIYTAMSDMGKLHVIAAVNDGLLVGFVLLLVSELPHYSGRLIATTESFFVLESERKGGTGAKLIQKAEDVANELGSVALLLSAPAGGALEKVAPIWG